MELMTKLNLIMLSTNLMYILVNFIIRAERRTQNKTKLLTIAICITNTIILLLNKENLNVNIHVAIGTNIINTILFIRLYFMSKKRVSKNEYTFDYYKKGKRIFEYHNKFDNQHMSVSITVNNDNENICFVGIYNMKDYKKKIYLQKRDELLKELQINNNYSEQQISSTEIQNKINNRVINKVTNKLNKLEGDFKDEF